MRFGTNQSSYIIYVTELLYIYEIIFQIVRIYKNTIKTLDE